MYLKLVFNAISFINLQMTRPICFALIWLAFTQWVRDQKPDQAHCRMPRCWDKQCAVKSGSVLSCQSAHPGSVQFTSYVRSHFNSRNRHSIYAHAQHFPSKRQEKCLHILSVRKHKSTALHNYSSLQNERNLTFKALFSSHSFLESDLINLQSR